MKGSETTMIRSNACLPTPTNIHNNISVPNETFQSVENQRTNMITIKPS